MRKIHISQILFFACIGIIIGSALGASGYLDSRHTLFVGSLILLGVFSIGQLSKTSLLFLICGMSIVGGFFHASVYRGGVVRIDRVGELVRESQAEVLRVPRQSENYLLIEARLQAEDDVGILIRGAKYDEVQLGDTIKVTCTLAVPDPIENFNYPMYFRLRKIYYLCENATYEVVGGSDSVLARLAQFRSKSEEDIAQLMRAPESGLASGLLFGGDDHLSDEVQESFARTGMSHITAVSGYNVTVITMVMIFIGIRVGLWRRQATICAIISIILFVMLIGFPASGVRAAIMGILMMLVIFYGRISSAWQVVVVACAGMLLWNPLQILYDVGFQLSFLAVCGILSFLPLFESLLIRSQRTMTIIETILLTISSQIFVTPVIVYHFGTFSMSSLLSNVLILPVLPLTMFLVFCSVLFMLTCPMIAIGTAILAQITLSYELFVINFFADQSWSTIIIPWGTPILWVLYYTTWIIIVYYFHQKNL